MVEFANQYGDKILYPKDHSLPIEMIAAISKEDRIIYLNSHDPLEIGRFCVSYLLWKDYLDKLV